MLASIVGEMAKFDVLQSNQRIILLTCGMDVNQKSKVTNSTGKFFTSFRVYVILFVLVNILLSFAAKAFNKSNDFAARLTAASIIIALCQAIAIFLNIGVNMQKMTALNQTLQSIVDGEGDLRLEFLQLNYIYLIFFFVFFIQAENDEIQKIYWHAEQKCRKYIKIIATTLLVYDQSMYVISFIYSIYCICIGNYDTSTWPVLLEMSVPFETKTIYGWYLLLFTLISMDIAYLTSLFLGIIQFMGYCIYITAICEHFSLIMQTVQANVDEQNLRETNRCKFEEIGMKIVAKNREAIQIHIKINEIFRTVATMNSASILALIPPNAVVLGIFLYQIHQVSWPIIKFLPAEMISFF